jgi:hypothetical protein
VLDRLFVPFSMPRHRAAARDVLPDRARARRRDPRGARIKASTVYPPMRRMRIAAIALTAGAAARSPTPPRFQLLTARSAPDSFWLARP